MKFKTVLVAFALATAVPLSATTFVVPSDEELVDKADAIVVGEVRDSSVERDGDEVFTVFSIRVVQKLKGGVQRDEVLPVYTLGGATPTGGVVVNGVARFENGEIALVFLTRDRQRRWTTTDMTLGKFRRVYGAANESLLARDLDDAGSFDRDGKPHKEKPRKEQAFLEFIAARVSGGRSGSRLVASPVATPQSVTGADPAALTIASAVAAFPPATYTSNVGSCTGCADALPTRWPDAVMAAGVPFYKRSDTNIGGAADGGVSVIQNGLAAWTNDCGSNVNLGYAGQTATPSKNSDSTHVVEFNDPQGRIGGSWTGSGTVAITFSSFTYQHTFQGSTWWSITDADVVFQDGYPATHPAFAAAMTHELGHAIGWRHSNEHYSGGACNSAVEECTSAAIMNSSAVASYGYTLQPWDVNAVRSVYPGGTCGTTCVAPTVTTQPPSVSTTSGTAVTLSVVAAGTGPLSYQWYSGASGSLTAPIAGATGTSLAVSPTSDATYWVKVSNACGAVNSATATVSVTVGSGTTNPIRLPSTSSTAWRMVASADFDGDGNRDIVLQNSSNGAIYVWTMRGTTVVYTDNFVGQTSSTAWQVRAAGDFNRDGSADLLLQNANTGAIYVWTMSRFKVLYTDNFVAQTSNPAWRVITAADFNADGNLDLLLQNSSTNAVVVWTMSALRVVNTENFLLQSSAGWAVVAAADFNRDGYADVVVRNASQGRTAVWYTSNLRVTSTDNFLPAQASAWRVAVAADFDRDGYPDLVWQNDATREVQMWLMTGLQWK